MVDMRREWRGMRVAPRSPACVAMNHERPHRARRSQVVRTSKGTLTKKKLGMFVALLPPMKTLTICAVLGLSLSGCDDTADAIGDEAREESREAEQELDEAERKGERAAEDAEREIEQAGERVERTVDEADKELAEEIREEE